MLTDIINEVYKLIEHQFVKNSIKCVIETDTELPFIFGDSTGLQQVYSNLLINAMHALEDKQHGPRMIHLHTYRSGEYIVSEVKDNGSGIPNDIIDKIFDPFFTTKDSEHGTGLGMAIVESILHKHQAAIRVDSEVGVVTKFIITFPAINKERVL